MSKNKPIITHIEKVYTRKRYVITSGDMKKAFGLTNKDEEITSFGLWSGRSPKMEEDGASPDIHDSWYIETNEGGRQYD